MGSDESRFNVSSDIVTEVQSEKPQCVTVSHTVGRERRAVVFVVNRVATEFLDIKIN